jgi:hypothetical protein
MKSILWFPLALRTISRVCVAMIVSLYATLAAWGAALPPPL